MVNENKLNVDDSLLEYYSLKNKYEKDYYDKYVKPIILHNYSKLVKRQKFQELKKPPCINCKQPVGTIFQRKYYEEYNNKLDIIVFTAKCGNLLNPCDLNIEIHKSLRESYDSIIKKNQEELNKYEMEIIKLKNKILFLGKNSTDNAEMYINEFNEYKQKILDYSQTIGEYTEQNIMINDNPEDNEKLKNLIISLNQIEIMQFKDYIKQYMETNNDNILNNAINMYIGEIIPKLDEIRKLKYKTMYVFNDSDKNHRLIQSKYSQEEMNFYSEYDDEVVSFIKGSKVESTKKSKLEISEIKSQEESKTIEKSKKSTTLKNVSKKTSKSKTQKKKLKISDENINEDEEKEESFPRKSEASSIIFSASESEKEKKQEEQEEQEEKEIIIPRKSRRKIIIDEEEEEEIKPSAMQTEPSTMQSEPSAMQSEPVIQPKKIGKKIILKEATEAL